MYTIAKAKEAVKDGIRGYLLKDQDGSYIMKEVNRLPFYLEGSPGIGKTEIVKQIAQELNLGYVSFSLVHHTRNSLLGLPVIKELENGDKYTCYTMSEIIAKVLEQVEAGFREGILLLDEFPCMSETILPAMLAFLQTKNIGTHSLPEGWVIVLCGNPPTYNKTARTFDAAIMDRIRKLEIAFESEVFLTYGEEQGMHQAILDYLRVNDKNVCRYKNEKKDLELVTCRGWENVSHMLKTYELLDQNIDKDCIRQYIKSEEIAADFYQFYNQYCLGMNGKCIEDILSGIRLERYIKKYKNMSYHQKWRALDYIVGYMEKKHQGICTAMTRYEEEERMIAEMKEEIEEESVFAAVLDRKVTRGYLRDKLRFDSYIVNTDLRREIMEAWKFSESDEDEILLDGESEAEATCREFERWHKESAHFMFLNNVEDISERLSAVLTFAEAIDQEGPLLEMLFGRINNSDLLLKVMSIKPSEKYIALCARRYAS